MSMDYRDMAAAECAARALNQLDSQEREMFEALYGMDADSVDTEYFTFGDHEEFWNVVANIFEGNIEELDAVSDSKAKETDDIIIHDGRYYDVSDFDKSLGSILENNMIEEKEMEVAYTIFMESLAEDSDITSYWDVELSDNSETCKFTCPTCAIHNYQFTIDVCDLHEVMIDIENQKLEFNVEMYAKQLQRIEDMDKEDSVEAAKTIKTALDVLYNNAKDIAKDKFLYEYIDFDKRPEINKDMER